MYRLLPILLGHEQEIVPDCLFANNQEIILEDLKPQGFLLGDRIKGLDFDHTKIVLEVNHQRELYSIDSCQRFHCRDLYLIQFPISMSLLTDNR